MTNVWDRRLFAALIVVLVILCTIPGIDSRRSNGPLIIPSTNEITLQKGQNYTLTCKGKTELQFKQQDIHEEVTGLFNKSLSRSTISEGQYKYKVVLELYNVDEFAIGYYACFDNTVVGSDVLDNLTEEPNGTAHITYIYIYVAGTGGLFAPMSELMSPRGGSKVVIECRPTTPDVNVTLLQDNADTHVEQYSPKLGFVIASDDISDCVVSCVFQKRDGSLIHEKNIIVITKPMRPPLRPEIEGGSQKFLRGETFTINCTIKYNNEFIATLSWDYRNSTNVDVTSNEDHVKDILYRNLTIKNATEENQGIYTCRAHNTGGNQTRSFKKKLTEPYITLSRLSNEVTTTSLNSPITLATEIDAYPPVTYYFLRDNTEVKIDGKKYMKNTTKTGDSLLYIKGAQVTDSADYTLVATNGYKSANISYVLRIRAPPVVTFGSVSDWTYRVLENTTKSLSCQVTGYPIPEVSWIFKADSGIEEDITNISHIKEEYVYSRTSYLDLPAKISGDVSCEASNALGFDNATRPFIVYEIDDGFGIKNRENNWFSQNQNVILTCVASKYDFEDVSWFGNDKELDGVAKSTNSLSLVATLKINQVSLDDSGEYECSATSTNGTMETDTISISVIAVRPPVMIEPKEDNITEVEKFQTIKLPCRADGVPPPTLEWYKDGKRLTNDTKPKIYMNSINRTAINSTLVIPQLKDDDITMYECIAKSGGDVRKRTYKLVRKADPTNMTLVSVIISIIFVLILLVGYLTWKIKKEKQFKRELRAAGLYYFKKGVTKSLNPDLGIDEQAELLPYNEKFEFSSEKLKLGKQLGAGAFGVVYKAEARGIINAEETTEVAVKMVKKTADNMYIKALASELKIMVHLGKHINIVNLLGACTKNVGKRELIVIVEYCKFGNIHNYMQRHREVFIDQLTDNKEKNFGRVNRGFCSTGSTGVHSDYFGTNNTQDTENTLLNTANTSRSGRKDNPGKATENAGVSEGYVQPEWRTNYESDYSFDGRNPRPLTSRDLLVWAFQIARGMEYLASRKILHGDLAARNVLLADDNVVKICDFGLARNIYNNDEYQKKENSLLPVKWLAIECMTDRIFSTQSDVWSFGIVLWELFSLAKTPYPNMLPSNLLQWLSEGNRLAKPNYADDKLYDVMLKCWEQKPTSRPSFSQLQERLGALLEDNVRNHYVDLNAVYSDLNVKADGQEDYLNMVCAPDYNNLVTPSPHHYANQSNFFPQTPTKLDEEGYLQMSPSVKQAIFSPRPQDTKFDFNAQRFNSRASEASSCGSELTPMLTLNNLPRSGSDSDHEGNVSPNPNVTCPSIKEEADEVFETKQNNAKNAYNTAVTNPTYIPFNVDMEKPKDIINTYVNVANGLVK